MSNFMVDRACIAYLIDSAPRDFEWFHNGQWSRMGDLDAASRAGEMLWDENLRSCQSGSDKSRAQPGLTTDFQNRYEYGDHIPCAYVSGDVVAVLRAIGVFNYNAGDDQGWATSEAKAYTDALRDEVIRRLPGYGEEGSRQCPAPYRVEHDRKNYPSKKD